MIGVDPKCLPPYAIDLYVSLTSKNSNHTLYWLTCWGNQANFVLVRVSPCCGVDFTLGIHLIVLSYANVLIAGPFFGRGAFSPLDSLNFA
jgi:hypothetical protein